MVVARSQPAFFLVKSQDIGKRDPLYHRSHIVNTQPSALMTAYA